MMNQAGEVENRKKSDPSLLVDDKAAGPIYQAALMERAKEFE